MKKVQVIIYLTRNTTTTEVRVIIGIIHCYRDTWKIRFHALDTIKEVASGPKGIKTPWNDNLILP